jgi:hypothetical protein
LTLTTFALYFNKPVASVSLSSAGCGVDTGYSSLEDTIGYYYRANKAKKMARMLQNETLESTNRLLRVMISLMLRRDGDQLMTVRQQIETLNRLGMRPTEIAATLGRTPTHINKELAGIRKAHK